MTHSSHVDPSYRYDRQVRLWGEEGQTSIGGTSVCLLGSDSLGTEILKSLVLAGVQSFFIVDDAIVEQADIGQNFFLHLEDVGRFRAEATLERLQELNFSVTGRCSTSSLLSLAETDVLKLTQFSVVVASNLPESVETMFSAVLHPLSVPFICAKTCGLIGSIKISIAEHTIANSHEENPKPDLRLDAPFDELLKMVNETNLDEMTVDQLRHTPYILLFFKALEVYRKKRNDPFAFPHSYHDRKEILAIVLSFRKSSDESGSKDSENFDEAKNAVNRSFQKTEISSSVLEILEDPSCQTSTQPFWLICEALKRFIEKNGLLPVRGTLPDMTSDTARYTRLATMFHEKALADAKEVLELTRIVEKERGVGDVISDEMCYRFCKNADQIRLQRGEVLNYQKESQNLTEVIKNLSINEEPQVVDCSIWLLIQRAVDRFYNEKGRYPGTNGVPCEIDSFDLKQRVSAIVKETAGGDEEKIMARIPTNAIAEMCRFGASELHVISSFVGGIAAQEVIKLATNQYVPLDNTFVFDGHTQKSTTLKI